MRLSKAIAQSIVKAKLQCRLVFVIIGFLYSRFLFHCSLITIGTKWAVFSQGLITTYFTGNVRCKELEKLCIFR